MAKISEGYRAVMHDQAKEYAQSVLAAEYATINSPGDLQAALHRAFVEGARWEQAGDDA